MTCAQRRRGFSRIDLVAVLVMTAIFLCMLFPAMYAAQREGTGKDIENNLKQIVIAMHSFNDQYKILPPAFGTLGNSGKGLNVSLHVHILPYIEQDKLYRDYLRAKGKQVSEVVVPTYVSPSDPSIGKRKREGIQNYPANLRVFSDRGIATPYDKNMPQPKAMEPCTGKLTSTITDGTSNTIFFATKYGYCAEDGGSRYASTPDTKTAAFFGQNTATKKAHPSEPAATFQLRPGPNECLCSPSMAQSFIKMGIYVGMGDGSTRQVHANISPETWNSAVQPNDGHPLGSDWP